MITTAVDYETYYDDKVSVATLGLRRYPQQAAAMTVGVVDSTGRSYVGPPSQCPWGDFVDSEWVSHNAPFDQSIHYANAWPLPKHGWWCSMAASRARGGPGALAAAAKFWLDRTLSKEVRNRLKGVHTDDLFAFEKPAIDDYALADAQASLDLWLRLKPELHAWDLKAIGHMCLMSLRGVPVDLELANQYRQALVKAQFGFLREWAKRGWGDLTKRKNLIRQCHVEDIPWPGTTRKSSKQFVEWEEQHADKVEWVKSIQAFRTATRNLPVVQSFIDQTWNGRIGIPLAYFGAVTGRFSCSKPNLLNLTRKGEIDLRKLLIAPAGKWLAMADYAQIEPRYALWFAEDLPALDQLRQGKCLYETFARQTLGYNLPEPLAIAQERDPKLFKLRQLAKACVLGAGYGAWIHAFMEQAKVQHRLTLTEDEAKTAVLAWRDGNPKILQCWNVLARLLCEHHGKTLTVHLPGWRTLVYHDVRIKDRPLNRLVGADEARELAKDRCEISYKGWLKGTEVRKKIYGAKLFENIVQSGSNMVLLESAHALETAEFEVLWHVYDENIFVANDEEHAQEGKRIMELPAPWREDLPLQVSVKLSNHYTK